jgi:hypothetical protein
MISLAKLATSSQTASSVLYDSINARNGQGVEAIGYLEPEACRALAEPLMKQEGNVRVRRDAAEILGAAGDAAILDMLKVLRSAEKSRMVQRALDSAIAKLQYKAANVPLAEQQGWSEEDLLLWRTLRETPDSSRRGDVVYAKAAASLKAQGRRISRSVLEYKVISKDLTGIALIGLQREAWAVDELRKYSPLRGSLGDFTRATLMNIGTPEAIAALHDSLQPDGSRRANIHIITMLGLRGGRQSAEFFKTLAQNEEFLAIDRKAMAVAARNIEKRLARR